MKFFASEFFSKKLSKKNCFSSVLRQGPFFFAAKWLQLVYTHKSKKEKSETNIVGACGWLGNWGWFLEALWYPPARLLSAGSACLRNLLLLDFMVSLITWIGTRMNKTLGRVWIKMRRTHCGIRWVEGLESKMSYRIRPKDLVNPKAC